HPGISGRLCDTATHIYRCIDGDWKLVHRHADFPLRISETPRPDEWLAPRASTSRSRAISVGRPRYLTATHGQPPGQVSAAAACVYVALQAGGQGFESPELHLRKHQIVIIAETLRARRPIVRLWLPGMRLRWPARDGRRCRSSRRGCTSRG